MGQVPPKYFLPSSPYGASPAANALSPVQPAAQNPQVPLLPSNFQDPGTMQAPTTPLSTANSSGLNPFTGGGGGMGRLFGRGLFGALILLMLSAVISATTTVTGQLQNLGTGTVGQGAFVRFWLRGCGGNQPRVNGTAVIAPSQGGVYYFDFKADANGNVSGTLYSTRDVTGNNGGDITCGTSTTSVWYGMQVFVGGKGGPEIPVHALNTATLNISSVTPITVNPVVTSPTGDSTYIRKDAGNNPVPGALQFQGNNTHSGAETFTGAMNANNGGALNGTFTGPTTLSGVSTQNNIIFADQQAGATADVKLNAAVAALPSAGGFVDARGFGATSQTIAATVTIGKAGKGPVTLFFDRSTTFNCTITNNTPCFTVQGNGTMMGFGMQANGATGIVLSASASVSNGLLVQGNQSTNQVGTLVEGLTVQGTSGATISDALCGVQNVLQLTKLQNVTCTNATAAVTCKLYATGGSNGITNTFFDNDQCDSQGTASSLPVWIGCAASGSTTGVSCTKGILAVNFIGGLGVHPGTGLPSVTIESQNGAGGQNMTQVHFAGYQSEVNHATDIGLLCDGCIGLTVEGWFQTTTAGTGADIFKFAQPAGTTLDGIYVANVTATGTWTNTFNNTQTGNTVTNSQCTNGCVYRYTRQGSNALKSFVFEDNNGYQAIIDSNGLSIGTGSAHSLRATNLLVSTAVPTISSHFNTSGDSISAQNGTAAFEVTVGTGTAGSTGAVTLPTATTSWNCTARNLNRAAVIQQTGGRSTTIATFTNYGTTPGTPVNWTNSDVLSISCFAY